MRNFDLARAAAGSLRANFKLLLNAFLIGLIVCVYMLGVQATKSVGDEKVKIGFMCAA